MSQSALYHRVVATTDLPMHGVNTHLSTLASLHAS
jgi:hypothetical protein